MPEKRFNDNENEDENCLKRAKMKRGSTSIRRWLHLSFGRGATLLVMMHRSVGGT